MKNWLIVHVMIDVHCQEDKDSHMSSWGLHPWCMALQHPCTQSMLTVTAMNCLSLLFPWGETQEHNSFL